ncbi:MAG: glycosyltransferase [Fibrobacteria bacterium]
MQPHSLKQPHLAHVVLGLPFGGTEILVERMLRTPPAGYAVSCLCLDSIGEVGERLRKDGIKVTLLNRKPGFDFGLPRRLARQTALDGIDVIHCHQYTPFFYGALARLFRPRLKVIFTEHGRFHPDTPSPKRRIFNALMQGRADSITAVSPAVKQALIDVEGFAPDRIEVVYNGISFPAAKEDRAALRARLGLDPHAFHFILCSRFDPIKWIPGLLEALRKAIDAHPSLRLVLVGDGVEKEAILAKRKALGLEQAVIMPGFQRNVSDWLRASDAFVLCSLNEGTSVSLIEAMAAGLPAVATRVGGNPYVVEAGETGLLVPASDPAALAEGLLALASAPDRAREMGAKARIRYEARFLPARMDATYAAMYERALGPA